MGYRGKVEERARARELRADGWPLRRIAEALGVSAGSVSTWVRDVPFTPLPRGAARRRAPNALQRRKAEEIAAAAAWGRDRIGTIGDRDLLVAGAALYAGEGAKRDGMVKFTNTDPRQVALFCRWLRSVAEVDERRMRGSLHLHVGLDLEAATAFWSGITGIPIAQFTAPHRPVPKPGRSIAKHRFGCASVRYSCTPTHRRIMGLVDALLGSQADGGSEGGT